ncbi:MarR family winged helix-turn-helix transcriptional regulator [Flavobacterium aestivum]|uniref:MarR family winged helix-turn-helix transcriptional regulator n=1 Tax=Flavobacterium aestivum TaxID=3003257 RepID=UPI0022868F96|nr:MarR family transcriptional regulator [Flavobacterium aestivum]
MMNFSEHLCFKTYAASRYIIGLYKPFLDEISLTYPQYLVMVVLWENGSMNISKIGEFLHLDNGTLTPLLKRMEKNGLLTRVRSSADERKILVSLTEEGTALKEKASHIPEAVQNCIGISSTKNAQLLSVLDELLSIQTTK